MITITKATTINSIALAPFIEAEISLSLSMNVFATSMIVFRLLNVRRQVVPYLVGPDKLAFIIRVVIEPGLLYTVAAFVTLLTSVTSSNGDYINSSDLVQITGIAFDLLIVRLGQSMADRNTPTDDLEMRTLSPHILNGQRLTADGAVIQVDIHREIVSDMRDESVVLFPMI
ncbi:hypothetical protein A0H81_10638 [Grifola frondosa]|uniref:Uncharacterized protein n=1 Tax=Grifola frondosa TaxID=5627 RepID=A0A1C7LXC4_GRIFR|nr:hypothetical protein A0H81_10638 [Grifola frondosa]